ncbi:MAG: DnaB-like helicase C-terminal domain-containing protein [Pseudomonadota bacterium]
MINSKPKTKPELIEYEGQDKIVPSHVLYHTLKAKNLDIATIKFAPELPKTIALIDGFAPGELIVLSGPTKNGKTLLAQTLLKNLADAGQKCLYFSYEVPPWQFLNQFEQPAPLFFVPQELHARKIDWFEERVLEGVEKFGIKFIFIDHLHFLFDMAKVKNSSLEIGSYVRRLKSFAVQNSVVIVLLCHITKTAPDQELSYNSLRDSSFIAQESDCVMLIRRAKSEMPPHRDAILFIEFHRRTGIWKEQVKLIKVGNYLQEKIEQTEEGFNGY